jgi:putative salt-induced outer membrane protein YdiY
MSSPVTSKFKLSIGGFVRLDYAYNSVNLGTNGGSQLPSSGLIPKTTSLAAQSNQSMFTARQSRFWLKVAGPTFLGARTGGLIEADFYGNSGNTATDNENAVVRMRHAYGTLDWTNTQVLFGQTNDMFGPMSASTLDTRSGGWGVPLQPRITQLRLTQKIPFNADNSLKLVLGVQNPNQDSNTNTAPTATSPGSTYGDAVNAAAQLMYISKALGQAPGYYGLSMNNLTFGPFGLIGRQNVNGNVHPLDSWGYGAYLFVPLLKSKDGKDRTMTASLEAEGYMAANLAVNTATPQAFVYGGAPTAGGVAFDARPAKAYGYGAQLIFYPVQDLGITFGYSIRKIYNNFDYQKSFNGKSYASGYLKSNDLIYANIAYDLNAAVRIAAEYENANSQYGTDPTAYTTIAGVPYPLANGTGTVNVGRFVFFYFF